MKKIILIFFIACSAATFAQTTGNSANNANNQAFAQAHLDRIKQDIALTTPQEAQIRALLIQLYNDREQIQKQAGKTNKQKIGEKRPVQDAFNQNLNAILTPAQQQTLQKKAKEREEAARQAVENSFNNNQ